VQLPTLEQARPHCPHGPLIAPCPAPARSRAQSAAPPAHGPYELDSRARRSASGQGGRTARARGLSEMLEGRTLVTGALFGLGGRGEAPQAQPRAEPWPLRAARLITLYDSCLMRPAGPRTCVGNFPTSHFTHHSQPIHSKSQTPLLIQSSKAPRGARFSFLCQPPATPTRADRARSNTPRVALQNFVLPVMRPSTNPAQLHVPLAGPLAYARRCHPT
jgi:hypothetical protein